jgi:hypothetical protein
MMSNEQELDELFRAYRNAIPEVEASPEFMPRLWQKIEANRSFSFAFQRLARILVPVSAAACLLLAALNMAPHKGDTQGEASHFATYTDALSAENTVERSYYSEIRLPVQSMPAGYSH